MENVKRTTFYSNIDTKISYSSSEKTKQEVFDAIINWVRKHDAWSGEILCQDDDCQIEAPQLLADIVDDILDFKYEEI